MDDHEPPGGYPCENQGKLTQSKNGPQQGSEKQSDEAYGVEGS